jgi:hypothetical protein
VKRIGVSWSSPKPALRCRGFKSIARDDDRSNRRTTKSAQFQGTPYRCRVWMLFAEPIWASGHVAAYIGRTHDRFRTAVNPCKCHLNSAGRPRMELAPTVHHLRHVTVATTVYLYPSSSGQSLASVMPTRRLRRVSVHHFTFGACSGSLELRPVRLLNRPSRPWSRGFDPAGYPAKPLVSYQVLPTTFWVDPSTGDRAVRDTEKRGSRP